jgi:formylglycine-generating enzyme required for sulfatase activity
VLYFIPTLFLFLAHQKIPITMRLFFSFLFCCGFATLSFAQQVCYDELLRDGDDFCQQGDTRRAVKTWQAAIKNCDLTASQRSALDTRINNADKNCNKQIPPPPPPVPDDMVLVQGSTFQMGSTDSEADADEKPVHQVTLSSFYMGKYEITQKQWREVMGTDP